jgi:hypothetical protein
MKNSSLRQQLEVRLREKYKEVSTLDFIKYCLTQRNLQSIKQDIGFKEIKEVIDRNRGNLENLDIFFNELSRLIIADELKGWDQVWVEMQYFMRTQHPIASIIGCNVDMVREYLVQNYSIPTKIKRK